MWNQIQSSWPPASSTSTRRFGSADSRLANTQPAEPAPTTIWSNVSVMAGEPSERRRERKRLGWLLLAPFENRQRLTGQMRRAVLRRSEEHTSELQSRQYLVCRLLLEKKKKKKKNTLNKKTQKKNKNQK